MPNTTQDLVMLYVVLTSPGWVFGALLGVIIARMLKRRGKLTTLWSMPMLGAMLFMILGAVIGAVAIVAAMVIVMG